MSVHARSLGSAGRPCRSRPAAAVVAALIAMLAVGAPAALAGETPGPGDVPPEVVQAPPGAESPPVDPPAVEPPPADSPPVDPPAVEPRPADPPPVDLPAVEPRPADPPPVEPPPAEPPPAGAPAEPGVEAPPPSPVEPAPPPPAAPVNPPPAPLAPAPPAPPADLAPPPAQSQGGDHDEAPESGEGPEDAAPGGSHSVAHNQNRVIQAVWQVQQGCRTHCHGTSQTQRSTQVSETTQSAGAVSGEGGGGGSSAEARNESSTIQFVWQMQIGCVAFCFHTSQSQEASQQASTIQEADAESALTAWADNMAETLQYVFQTQRGCEHECHGTAQHQSAAQSQSTSQSATAKVPGGHGPGDAGGFLLPDWLIAYARNVGATIQTIFQYQEALCLEHCDGEAQLQEAIQHARTDQRAAARAAPPEPAESPPGEQPSGASPPSGEAAPLAAAPGAVVPAAPSETAAVPSDTAAPNETAAPSGTAAPNETAAAPLTAAPNATAAAPLTAAPLTPATFTLGERRQRTTRRQDLVLRAGGKLGPAAPDASAPVDRAAAGGRSSPTDGATLAPTDGPALAPTDGAGFGPTAGAGFASGSAASGTETGSGHTPADRSRDSGAIPARTIAVPPAPSPGGSGSWPAILLAAAALAVVFASLRRALATHMTRI